MNEAGFSLVITSEFSVLGKVQWFANVYPLSRTYLRRTLAQLTQRLTAIVAQQLAEAAALGQECLLKCDSEGKPAIRTASDTDSGAVLTSNITTRCLCFKVSRHCGSGARHAHTICASGAR